MKIRTYAKSIGFEIVGKIRYMGKRGILNRCYMDEAGNTFLIDMALGTIQIITPKKDKRRV